MSGNLCFQGLLYHIYDFIKKPLFPRVLTQTLWCHNNIMAVKNPQNGETQF